MSFRLPSTTTTLRQAVAHQIHLWFGMVTGMYLLVLGVTGTVLIFRPMLQARAYPQLFAAHPPGTPLADPSTVLASLDASYPGARYGAIEYPTARRGTFLTYVAQGDVLHTVFSDAASGAVIGELPRRGWIQQVQEFHFNMKLGQPGIVTNGVASACLLLLCLTGVAMWRGGVNHAARAVIVDARRSVINPIWTLHGVIGIWTVPLLALWAVSGIYFSFPVSFRNTVGLVAPMSAAPIRQSGPPSNTTAGPPSTISLLERARARVPGAHLARFFAPNDPRGTYAVVLARGVHGDSDTSDEVTVVFDRYSGAELAVEDQRADRTVGDSLMIWLARLHIGDFGGLPIRVLWTIASLAIPLLYVTGVAMWFFRMLARVIRPARPAADR